MKLFLATTMLAIAAGKEPLRGSSLRGAEKDCILEEVSLLRIPGQVLSDPLHPGEDMDGDTVFECLDNNGMTTVLDMDKEQKNALHQMIRDGSIVPGKTSLDISQATRTKNKISLPPGKINIKAKKPSSSGTQPCHNNRHKALPSHQSRRYKWSTATRLDCCNI
uniref:Uncharacterized protein n=1 Tax=Ditylum brightwellii TaxID=49249 RepID=A0A7S4UV30_9STRA